MTTPLARRIQTLAAVEISLVLVAVIVAGALLAFGFYIRTLSNELSGTHGALEASLRDDSVPNARAGATSPRRCSWTGSEIVFLDANTRVTVYRIIAPTPDPPSTYAVAAISPGDPRASGPLARGHTRPRDGLRAAVALRTRRKSLHCRQEQ